MTENTLDQILNRVKRRLDVLGISEHAAEQSSGAKIGTIRNWRRGAMPRIETLKVIAPALKTTPQWLAYESGPEDEHQAALIATPRLVPKISWVSAGAFASTDAVLETDDFDTIAVNGLPEGGKYAALEVIGDSMDRISPPESVIIVNLRDKRLVTNACYIIQDGEGGATYKRYRQSPDRFEPVSTNAKHEPIFPENDSMPEIFGRVVRSYIDM
ncbi:MAG TPA: S24 family peptidase [Pararhizobium sp.]|uniref:S24 family peptidase n=1 Tax=Pararhizobium sp. TaxID=1977563 RepID=UPI002C6354D9|nr:S24 family peptidase [Pararhizobium sp.]HTO29627.1 S24 family peptidase [Pararhizobium sp.]